MKNLKLSNVFLASLLILSSCEDPGPPTDHSQCGPKWVMNDENSLEISYPDGQKERVFVEKRDSGYFMEDDIYLLSDLSPRGNVELGRPWPQGVLVYQFGEGFSRSSTVMEAMKIWEEKTNGLITFKQRTNEENFVEFIEGDGCWSYIGMNGGKQNLSLGSGCYAGQAVHEIGHALGLFHEHTRFDRDDFVQILWCNIEPDKMGNFIKVSVDKMVGDYDFESVMHYTAKSFSNNGYDTIVSLGNEKIPSTRNAKLSEGDILSVKTIYE